MKILFIVGQHGDEQTPLRVIKQHFPQVDFVVANPAALAKKVRFIDSDMNRSFPGSLNGNMEEQEAYKLLKRLKVYDLIIDLHTATVDTPIFAIVTKNDLAHVDLVKATGVKRVVYMEESIASGQALIDHVNLGISLECGREGTRECFKNICQVINHLLNQPAAEELEQYTVFDILKKKSPQDQLVSEVESFKLVKKGDLLLTDGTTSPTNFYPVLPREKYPGVLTLMARKEMIQ